MKRNIIKIISLLGFLMGLGLIGTVLFPILSYSYFTVNYNLLSPLVYDENQFKISDYTKASNWFVGGVNKGEFSSNKVISYNLSIPKLKINNAKVIFGSEDLEKSLIQYPGTSLPGEIGNAAIFGHSALPIFYNPKSLTTIFSLLPTMKKGDEIKIEIDGVTYTYFVEKVFEVKPTDLYVLNQDIDNSYISLITCTPPGDPRNPKRLVVKAKLVPPDYY